MKIDSRAPLSAREEILISAPVEQVWSAMSEIDRWAEWQSDVTAAKLDGELKAGTTFHWKAKGLNIVSTIQVCEPMHRMGWTGNSPGMQAVHLWTFEPSAEGTLVTTEESLSGWFARLLKVFDAQFLKKSLLQSLQVFKEHVEGQSRGLP